MTDFLEECRVRFADAQKRVQSTQQDLMAAQSRHQTAVQEANSLQFMISAETARRQQVGNMLPIGPQKPEVPVPVSESSTTQTAETNKTDLVRELLRQRPAGITPTEIWKEVKGQMTHRAYLYSILGRLKDRGEVTVNRRKKYFLRVIQKAAEEKEMGH